MLSRSTRETALATREAIHPASRSNIAQLERVIPQESVLGHFLNRLKQRIRLRIDARVTRTARDVLAGDIEHLNMSNQYRRAVRTFQLEELEGQVKEAELQQRMEAVHIERWLSRELQQMRLQREIVALQTEMAKLEGEARKALAPVPQPQPELSPLQRRAIKKAEIEEILRVLAAEEAQALLRATDELEKRRLKNMYANRRAQLMEQLEKFL